MKNEMIVWLLASLEYPTLTYTRADIQVKVLDVRCRNDHSQEVLGSYTGSCVTLYKSFNIPEPQIPQL